MTVADSDLVIRLEAGDPLHREGAAAIRRLYQDIGRRVREADRDARDAHAEGVWSERQGPEEVGTW